MKKRVFLSVVVIFAFSGPTFAAIVYSGSQDVTLTLQGGMSPPPEMAMISVAGAPEDWDDFIISLEYIDLMDPMGMMAMGTRLTIMGSMAMSMSQVVVRPLSMPVQAWNLARGDMIGPDSPPGGSALLSLAIGGQTIAGEFGAEGGYIGLLMPGSTFCGWLHVSTMSDLGLPTQSITLDGWAYENIEDMGIRAGYTGVIPAPAAIALGGLGIGLVAWLRRRRTV